MLKKFQSPQPSLWHTSTFKTGITNKNGPYKTNICGIVFQTLFVRHANSEEGPNSAIK